MLVEIDYIAYATAFEFGESLRTFVESQIQQKPVKAFFNKRMKTEKFQSSQLRTMVKKDQKNLRFSCLQKRIN